MKTLALAILATLLGTPQLMAALLTHFDTTEGRISVILQYDKAPLAVANFITLAEGTRPHLDPDTGAISTKPYYIGESFYRVVNTATFRIAQTGSGTGTNSGGPGFTFPDEFDPSLRHVPYVLSMANSGPNTNGSQIFFVGNSSPSHLDDVHTIFGVVTDPASQAVIDAIHNAGDNGSSITDITFERTDAAAEAFDEMAQGLPRVVPVPGSLDVDSDTLSRFILDPPAGVGDIIHASRSTDLSVWQNLDPVHTGIGPDGAPPALSQVDLDDASAPRAFYQLACARHPESFAPSHLNSRSLSIVASGQTQVYRFDATGLAGDIDVYSGTSEGSPLVSGTFTVSSFSTGAHHTVVIAETDLGYPSALNGSTIQYIPQIKCGWDVAQSLEVEGRHSTSYFDYIIPDPTQRWQPLGSGACSVTR